MGRQARQFSKTGLYHIVFRGVNHCHLFEVQEDYEKLLSILLKVKDKFEFQLLAYCFMSDHVHLFLSEKTVGDVTKI